MKHAFNHWCIVSKDTGEITVEQKRINNALMKNHNAIIKLVTKAANGYRNWERFRNRCMLALEKGIDFEIDKDDGSIKMVEKMDPDNKMLSEPNISYKPFWGICRPLNSWRANSPNPIQICCAFIGKTHKFKNSLNLMTLDLNISAP